MPPSSVYFDHNATSPPDQRVVEAMMEWLGERHGNPSSIHSWGQRARGAVEQARSEVAALIDARPEEIVFTASGTEANNTVVRAASRASGRMVVSTFEHPSIVQAVREAESTGVEVIWIPPEENGVVAAEIMSAAITVETDLVALMLANNELGTLQPVRVVAERCRELDVPMLCDAVQAVGKIPVSVVDLQVDYLTVGAHKFHGPAGAAALWVRTGREVAPLLVGGGQERQRRASTENLPALVGFGRASELARLEMTDRNRHLAALRDRFEAEVLQWPGVTVHCRESTRLPNTCNLRFAGVVGQSLVIRLDLRGFAVSTGSACASGSVEPSATLLALGLDRQAASSAIRVSFGRSSRMQEVDAFLEVLQEELARWGALESIGV